MSTRIFVDKKLLFAVNDLIHPAVKEYLMERIREAREDSKVELFFIEAALLIETGYKSILDELWYIHADEKVRSRRLEQNRGYTPEKIANIMDKQLSEEAFRSACDFCIENSGSLESAFAQIDERLRNFTRLENR